MERRTMDETTASDVRDVMRQAAADFLDTDMADGDLMTCTYTLAAGFRSLDTGTVTTQDGLPAFTEPAPGLTDLLTAARAAIPALDLLGDFIGNTFAGKIGIPAFDRCAVILALKTAIAKADAEPGEAGDLASLADYLLEGASEHDAGGAVDLPGRARQVAAKLRELTAPQGR